MLASNAVAIHRLKLKGDKRSCRALMQGLQNGSDLTLPPQWRERWILVRTLAVKSTSRHWQQHASAQLTHSVQQAIPGTCGGAAQANAIWFASLPEMIAFLVIELALGQTAHWYWQQWRHLLRYPRDEALARLLLMYQEHTPAIAQQLLRQQKLATVWTQLSDGSAKTLANELVRFWQLPSLTDHRNEAVSPSWRQTLPSVFLSSFSISPWQSAIKHLPANDGRVLLASVIFGVMYAPNFLRASAAHWHSEFLRRMTSGGGDSARKFAETIPHNTQSRQNTAGHSPRFNGRLVQQLTASESIDSRGTSAENEQLPIVQSFAYQTTSITVSTQPQSESESVHSSRSDFMHQDNEDIESVVKQNGLSSSDIANAVTTDSSQWLAEAFTTQFGGVFYLLNPLHSLITSELLLSFEGGSAWHGLWDVYRVFARRSNTIDTFTDKPLRDFFAAQIFPFHSELERQICFQRLNQCSPHALAEQWFSRLEGRFGEQSFWKALQHDAAFFATPAHVVSSASHLDVYFPLSKARLDLRLAAWDINPGWLPWLSRVVTFHYVDSLDEAGEQ